MEKLEDILKKEKELYSYGKTKIDNKIYYPGFFIVTGERMIFDKFNDQGFLEEFHIDVGIKLRNLQQKIYYLTKDLIIDHNTDLNISDKLNLPFKFIPKNEAWSKIMTEINNSYELNDLIEHQEIINSFRKIFKNPVRFPISLLEQDFQIKKEFYIIGTKMKVHGLYQKTLIYKKNFQALFGFP